MDEDTTITISKEIANNVLKYYIPSYDVGKNRGQIASDRPHQTETAEIVPYNTFQVETGFTYEKDMLIQRDTLRTLTDRKKKRKKSQRFAKLKEL
jgi:hypothetical protein